jgi:hypothetical protein
MADLSKIAHQAENYPGFVAAQLAAYQRAHNLDDRKMAKQLHCTVGDLTHLKLCQRPQSREDIERIAAHAHVDATALEQVLNSSSGDEQDEET